MKKQNLTLSIALAAIFSSSVVMAEVEITGKIVHETAFFTNAGSVIGDKGISKITGSGMTNDYRGVTTSPTPAHKKNDIFKSETIARILIDGEADEIADGATFHVELQGYVNNKSTSNYKNNESYTQRDVLREAYVDFEQGDWSIRAGKQQVVWGTADGMKLLDMINPTDYGEMAQNQMEDSRIPVWMVNAETVLDDGSELQVVVSQPKENVFVGLNRNVDTTIRRNNMFLDDTTLNNGTDTGNAFMMKGPNTITGQFDGFLNITPDLGSVATRFSMAFDAGTADPVTGANMGLGNLGVDSMMGFTVNGFEGMNMAQMSGAMGQQAPGTQEEGLDHIPANFQQAMTNTWNALAAPIDQGGMGSEANRNAFIGDNTGDGNMTSADLKGSHMLAFGFAPLYDTNLANLTPGDDTAFDYMGNTTFRTFDSFVNVASQYKYTMPKNSDVDLAIRTKKSLESGLNYSLNASYNYDKNPIINLSWRGDSGQKLDTYDMPCPASACGQDTISLALVDSGVDGIAGTVDDIAYGGAAAQAAKDAAIGAAMADGVTDPQTLGGIGYAASLTRAATLQYEQTVKRVLNLGGSFDMAIETATLGPVVIRGEALYTKGSYSPIIDKVRLGYGDLVSALKMQKGNRAQFVLGADITALTNMMISGQFIQASDLNFVNEAGKYTADYATMSLSNGFNGMTKDKNFYSLFFSKPFGASGEHRWNNITMYEENGGKWNRLDAEFSIDDDTQATVEYNKYWGNENTQFGQLKNASNIQVGVKYSF